MEVCALELQRIMVVGVYELYHRWEFKEYEDFSGYGQSRLN